MSSACCLCGIGGPSGCLGCPVDGGGILPDEDLLINNISSLAKGSVSSDFSNGALSGFFPNVLTPPSVVDK